MYLVRQTSTVRQGRHKNKQTTGTPGGATMVESFAHFMIRWRFAVILITLVVVGITGFGGQKLAFSNDYRDFFGSDNPQLKAFERMQNTFNKNDNISFIITPKDGRVFSVATLSAIKDLTTEAWQIPFSNRVDSITNYQHTRADGDDLMVADLVSDPASLSSEQLLQIQDIAVNEPMLLHRLISPDSHYTSVNAILQLPGKSLNEVPTAVAFARDLKQRMLEKYPELEIRLTGMVVMNNAFPEASESDATHLYPLALGFILLTLLLLLRGLSGTVTTLFIIFFSIISAMGLAGWLGINLSPPVMSAPIMILTMAIANAVHLLVSMRHEIHEGRSPPNAMVESMRINFEPVFVTSLTTMLGFLSLNFSDSPPFQDLGNIAAIGVGFAWLYSVTFLPAMITILPAHSRKEVAGRQLMRPVGDFVVKHHNRLFYACLVVFAILIAMLPRNELNDVFVDYFDQSIEFRRDTDYAAAHLTGVYFMDFSIRTPEAGGISDPHYLQAVEKFVQHMRAQKKVIHVFSITDTFKRLNQNMHADDPSWYHLPEERNLAAQYLLLYEMSLPYGLDLNNQIDIEKRATRTQVALETMSTSEVLAMEAESSDWLAKNLPEYEAEVSGPTVMFSHIGQRNIRSMLVGTSVALVMISLVLIIFLRSLKYGFISLLPNLVPAAAAFGIWGLFVGQVGLGLSVVTGMTLGIVVDDTVHFLSKYLRARREKQLSAEDAVRYAFNSVGIALVVTSVVLIAGFMLMAQSHFKLNSEMGLLTSVVIALALLADFLFLPPLLIKFAGKTNDK
jgi:hypothetical protein